MDGRGSSGWFPELVETWGMVAAGDRAEMSAYGYSPGPTVDYIGIPYYVISVVDPRLGDDASQRRARSIVVGWRGGSDWQGPADYGIVIPPVEITGAFQILSPATDGESLDRSAQIRVSLPVDSELAVWVDGRALVGGVMNVGPRAHNAWTAELGLPPGEHVLTVAWFRVSAVYGPPGAIVVWATDSVVFDVD